MLIKQKRIRGLSILSFLKKGNEVCFGFQINDSNEIKIKKLGLLDIEDNINILPPIVGSVSTYNAEGKEEKQKHLPKETHYSEIYWTRHQWIGGGRTREITEIAYRPYKKYPVKYIQPVNIEIYKKDKWIYSPVFVLGKDDKIIEHTINLFLELFGECEILGDKKNPIVKTSGLVRFNREFIKSGTTWNEFKNKIEAIILKKTEEQKKVIYRRLSVAEKLWFKPVGYGMFGFKGYIAFQNQKRTYTIFENVNFGNAIYITDMDWIDFSKKDKQTILNSKNHKDRIIHNKGWENKLRKYC
ncbi:MAG: hypothetical protein PHR61_01785 [Candidatus Absconditabacteria bacterium]|nr:hypothetical protein [Candidatus Absconditabacteria bacterium]